MGVVVGVKVKARERETQRGDRNKVSSEKERWKSMEGKRTE